ncbi:5'-methylthioadenosine/S-adenosylhomocysteine nucleosidase [Actinokineospora inagensis]|uniref:5'-methylthioadenosine/S-adenosylhomocysteine nucleosidase family protein n=1 Tax=Actinokineospora inagensis TaxID=103730 RepID=UPI000421DF69|nr:5'-methylthioadenosine/S-adenosylhomocysteine nucleosidase [Actinokineospora inagensis]
MFVILTALDEEYLAIRHHCTGLRTEWDHLRTRFEVGRVTGGHEVAIACSGTGNGTTATITGSAITRYRPGFVLFVGIAGGLRDRVAIGDVVVGTRIYAYQGGRLDENGFHARPQAFEAPHDLLQTARHVGRTPWWRHARAGREAAVHFAPIAAGEVILADRESELARRLGHHFNDATAIETESAGMAHAGHLNGATPTMSIRGISDFADRDKDRTRGSGARDLAAGNAAAFAAALVAEHAEVPPASHHTESGKADMTFHNNMSGNARVTNQIGVLHGGLTVHPDHGAPGPAVGPMIARLTSAAYTTFNTGGLDEDQFGTAMLELDNLRKAVAAGADPAAPRTSVLALAELFRDVPRLHDQLSEIIEALP